MSTNFDLVNKACMDAFAQSVGEGGHVEAYVSLAAGALVPPPRGDFRNQATVIESAAEADVRTRIPMLGVRTSEFPAGITPIQGDVVTIGTAPWIVVDVDDNGAGHAWLRLQRG